MDNPTTGNDATNSNNNVVPEGSTNATGAQQTQTPVAPVQQAPQPAPQPAPAPQAETPGPVEEKIVGNVQSADGGAGNVPPGLPSINEVLDDQTKKKSSNKITPILLLILLVLLLGLGAGYYWFYVREESEPSDNVDNTPVVESLPVNDDTSDSTSETSQIVDEEPDPDNYSSEEYNVSFRIPDGFFTDPDDDNSQLDEPGFVVGLDSPDKLGCFSVDLYSRNLSGKTLENWIVTEQFSDLSKTSDAPARYDFTYQGKEVITLGARGIADSFNIFIKDEDRVLYVDVRQAVPEGGDPPAACSDAENNLTDSQLQTFINSIQFE